MPIRITTLVENTQGQHRALKNEHGLSLFIESNGHRLLFDTGQSAAFLGNAETLMVDLSGLKYVVLSHGHYDHTGGFRALTQVAGGFELFVGGGFFRKKYGIKEGACEFLGNSFDEAFLAERSISHTFVTADTLEVFPGAHLVTNFERTHEDEKINPRFKLEQDGELIEDDFGDEVCLALDTPKGLAVVLGCSHPGVKNILETVSSRLKKPIHSVLGGTHLVEASPESIRKTIEFFKAKDIQQIGVSHCTGQAAMESLKFFSDRFYHNRTGSCLRME